MAGARNRGPGFFFGHDHECFAPDAPDQLILSPAAFAVMNQVLLEAIGSGLLVLTARTAGAEEIVGDGTRVIAEPNNPLLLAKSATDTGLGQSKENLRRAVTGGNS